MAGKRVGYIQNLTPKKKSRIGNTYFHFQLQHSPEKSDKVLGFGEDNYRKLEEYQLSKSAVKIQLKDNEKYNTLLLNESCKIENTQSFFFPFQEMEETPFESPSLKIEISSLQNACPDGTKKYTVQGMVFMGPDDPKTLPSASRGETRVVKEDIVLRDETGSIDIHVWQPILANISDKQTYQFTNLKLKKFLGAIYLTTSPQTTAEIMKNVIDVNDAENIEFSQSLSQSVVKLNAQRFEDVGEVVRFVSCKQCKKKITNTEIGKKTIKCSYCKKNFRRSDLQEEAVIELTFLNNGQEVKVTATAATLSEIVDLKNHEEENIAEKLLEVENFALEYNSKTNMLNALFTDEKDLF